jgi:signal transduction histidine kinase
MKAARPAEGRSNACNENELITHLQAAAEHDKAALARELHDDLGGLLVAAIMDVAWAEQHLVPGGGEVSRRLVRVKHALESAVEMKRRIIEELRPTLLDNVGLFAALGWQFKSSCVRRAIPNTESIPEHEPQLAAAVSIGLFRIEQEALSILLEYGSIVAAHLRVSVEKGCMIMQLTAEGPLAPAAARESFLEHTLASMRHRVGALGGELDIALSDEALTLRVSIRILA